MAAGGSGPGAGGSGRAVDAALSGRPFESRTMGMVRASSSRLVDRWAPERGATRRSRSLRSLSFVDRLLGGYVGDADDSSPALSFRRAAARSRRFRSAPPTSWLFPVPWYRDELAWLDAARMAPELAGGGAAPVRSASISARELPLIAPALGAPARPGRGVSPMGAPQSIAIAMPAARSASAAAELLRAWSPVVPFAQAQAAEVMAGALGATPAVEGDGQGGYRATTAPVMELLAPAELAPARPQAPAARRPAATRTLAARLSELRRSVERAPAPVESAAPVSAAATALLARTAVDGGAQLAPASGPRVSLPAGLGGLVAGYETAARVARPVVHRAPAIGFAPTAPPTRFAPHDPTAEDRPTPIARRRPVPPTPIFARSALSAIEDQRPRSLGHVAWADHWLARFSGASASALTGLDLATESPLLRFAGAAPQPIFLAPPSADPASPSAVGPSAFAIGGFAAPFLRPAAPTPAAGQAPSAPTAAGRAPTMPVAAPPVDSAPTEALRIDDDEAVPDAMFEALARAAAGIPEPTARQTAAPPTAPTPPARRRPASGSAADRLLALPPSHPGPGMSAGLAASPVAPALAPLLELPATPSFDVRTTAPAALARAYLGGALLPLALREPGVTGTRYLGPLSLMAGALPEGVTVHPAALRALAARAPEVTFLTPTSLAAAFAGEPAAGDAPQAVAADRRWREAPARPVVAPDRQAIATEPAAGAASAADESAAGAAMPTLDRVPAGVAIPVALSRAVGGAPVAPASWSSGIGRTAERAEAWGVDRSERSADLAYDFVSPELVLAARVYGFGAGEAAEAARLAAGGRTRLARMASAVDYAFVAALSGAEEAGAMAAVAGGAAGPGAWSRAVAAPPRTPAASAAAGDAPAMPMLSGPEPADARGALAAWSPSPGQPQRRLRGAFLWPETALSALGIVAADADEQHPMARAALDLLAAHVVAEAGVDAVDGSAAAAPLAGGPDAVPHVSEPAAAPPPAIAGPVPAGFEAVYLALSRSPEGRALPPTVRAARALAMTRAQSESSGRPTSARERAAAAWAVMPMVMTGGADEPFGGDDQGAGEPPVARAAQQAQLARSRAGESLRSLVAPTEVERRRTAAQYEQPIARPAPQQPVVQTGARAAAADSAEIDRRARQMATQARAKGELGQLPPWLESAARRMLEESSGDSEGLSFAELTLVTAAPIRYVAASPASAAQPARAIGGGETAADTREASEPNVDEIADKVFKQLQWMIDVARERNGDPWE